MENQDPQSSPEELGTEAGQSLETEQAVQTEVNRLAELEAQNRELQRRLTQKGRELAQHQQTPSMSTSDPSGSNFWEDPEARIAAQLAGFEQRQEQRRQAERMVRTFAEDKGIPERELYDLEEQFQRALQDPYDRMDMLARLRDAQRAQEAVNEAKKSTAASVQQNARAVTTESEGAHISPPGKSPDEMTLEEHRAYLVKKFGETEPRY
jgi:hypothetical protein